MDSTEIKRTPSIINYEPPASQKKKNLTESGSVCVPVGCCCFNLLVFASLTSCFDADCAPYPKPRKIIKTGTVSSVEQGPIFCLSWSGE